MNRVIALALLTAGGLLLRNQMKKSSGGETGGTSTGRMSTSAETIEVFAPVRSVYNQWTQFEDFPKFMAGVLEVRQIDDTHLHWRAEVGGQQEEWDSEITQQIPDRIIAWRSTSGARNEGAVTFVPISDSSTRIELRIDYEPRGVVERIGDALGMVTQRARGNLERFKSFLESRGGGETGAWRGSVDRPAMGGAGG